MLESDVQLLAQPSGSCVESLVPQVSEAAPRGQLTLCLSLVAVTRHCRQGSPGGWTSETRVTTDLSSSADLLGSRPLSSHVLTRQTEERGS